MRKHRAITNLITSLAASMGYSVIRQQKLAELQEMARSDQPLRFIKSLPDDLIAPIVRLSGVSRSQLCQDLFVLAETGMKQGGYFVEFGAADGVLYSNTHLLEKHFGWVGILAEPARSWHPALSANRSCTIEHDCVWTRSGEHLQFSEAASAELSTISAFSSSDKHADLRARNESYAVRTVSLNDLLARHAAPQQIDFLSIDTEGSEYSILEAFDFSRHSFQVIACEHNHTENREKIFTLLSSKGYRRKCESVSDYDDWYVYAP